MTSNQMEILWIVLAVIGFSILILVVTQYIDKINSARHPLAKTQSLFGNQKTIKQKVSPKFELMFGCVLILLSIVMFLFKGQSILWLIPVMFFLAGLRNIWVFIKSIKNEKAK